MHTSGLVLDHHARNRSHTLVYCGRFQRAKNFDCISQNTFHKTSAKHRKTPQNTAKQSQNAFCEITSQNTVKQTQNAQKSYKTVALQPQYVLRAFGVFFKNTLDLSQKVHNAQYA